MKQLPKEQPPKGWRVDRGYQKRWETLEQKTGFEFKQMDDAQAYVETDGPLRVLLGFRRYDGKSWAHLSVSCKGRLPTWEEMKRVKRAFLGPEIEAVQVFAPESEWVNIHPFVLHLWACLEDERFLPDFRLEGNI